MTYKPNPWFEEQLAEDPAVVKACEDAAAEALTVGQRLADEFAVTGAYRGSLQVDGATLFSDDEGAVPIEVGSDDTPPRAVLRRAAEMVGARFVDGPPDD